MLSLTREIMSRWRKNSLAICSRTDRMRVVNEAGSMSISNSTHRSEGRRGEG